nr:hypothetical protein [Tanacetum cinerariifolium]
MVEDDHDVIHDNNSSNLALSASLNDLDFMTLNIDGKSTKVEAPPDIIPVDDDDDFIDDEDDVLHDLAYSKDEVLANDDDNDDEATTMPAAVVRDHDGDGSVDAPPRPPSRQIGLSCRATRRGGKDGGRKGCVKAPGMLGSRKPWKDMARKRLECGFVFGIINVLMTTIAGRHVAASRGRGTGERAGSSGGRTRGCLSDQGDGRIDGQGGQVGGQGSKVNDGVNGVPDFSTIIAQQL